MYSRIEKSLVSGHSSCIDSAFKSATTALLCLALLLALGSPVYAVLLGNFESADSNEGWDNAPPDGTATLIPGSNEGVTLGEGSLKVINTDGYWNLRWQGLPMKDFSNTTLKFDYTIISEEWDLSVWTKVAEKITLETDGNNGYVEFTNAAATNRNTGVAGDLSWGRWWSGQEGVENTVSLDLSDYVGQDANVMKMRISIAGAGPYYFDNFRLVVPTPPALHVDANLILTADGDTVVLRGISTLDVGMIKEWYGNLDYVTRIMNRWDANGSNLGWYPKVIRYVVCPNDSGVADDTPIAFNPHNADDPNNEALYQALKGLTDYTAQNGAYSIICLRYKADISTKVTEANTFWNYMAPLFANDSNVLFEIFDEPTNHLDWPTVKANSQILVNTIRRSADNLVLVPGGDFDQNIGPAAYDPVVGGNIVYSVHFYPATWINTESWVTGEINPVIAVHPVMVTSWGFETDPEAWDYGTIDNYAQPFLDYLETRGIGSVAGHAAYSWGPPMFDANWQLLGDGNEGAFIKDWLYDNKDNWISPYTGTAALTIKKCSVKAGKLLADGNQGQDTFTASGTFNISPRDLGLIDQIDVNIMSLTDDNYVVYSESMDCNASRLKAGKFKYTYRIPKNSDGNITSLSIDFNKKTFSLTATKVDLTGLACPLRLNFTMGGFVMTGDANEAIVNGKSKTATIPSRLRRLFDDTLIVTSAKDTNSTKDGKDLLSVTGDIAVENMNLDVFDPNLVNEDVNIIWGTQTFMIPHGSFKAYKPGRWFKCGKAEADANVNDAGKVTASIDFDKCKYTISVKDVNLVDTNGVVSFGLNFADYNQAVNVTMNKGKGY